MIYPRHNKFYKWFFDFYTSYIIKADFKEFLIEGSVEDLEKKSVLVIANHYSWWDGFFHYYLNNRVLRKKYHVMMLEEQLKMRMFLTKLGIFSVKKGSKEALDSLRFVQQLLNDVNNMVLIFPQGKIESQHQHLFSFEKGVERLIQQNTGLSVVFAVSLIDYFSERKPVVKFYLQSYKPSERTLQDSFNDFFQDCVARQKRLSN